MPNGQSSVNELAKFANQIVDSARAVSEPDPSSGRQLILLAHSTLSQSAMRALVEMTRKYPLLFNYILLKNSHCSDAPVTIHRGKNECATFYFAKSRRSFYAKLPCIPVVQQFFDYACIDAILRDLAQVDAISDDKTAAYLVNFIVQIHTRAYQKFDAPKIEITIAAEKHQMHSVHQIMRITFANKSFVEFEIVKKDADFAFVDTKSTTVFMVTVQQFAQQFLTLQSFYTTVFAIQNDDEKMKTYLPRWNNRTIRTENASHVAHIAFYTKDDEETRKTQIAKYFGILKSRKQCNSK